MLASLVDYLASGRRQALLFTCHPETRDLALGVDPGCRLIELGAAGLPAHAKGAPERVDRGAGAAEHETYG